MKKHLGHLAMCAPMFLIVGVLIAGGAGFGTLFLLVGCVLMMSLMMGGMDHGGHGDRDRESSGHAGHAGHGSGRA